MKLEFQKLEFFEKKNTSNLPENFLWYSSTMENSISSNSSTQKVVDPYIFPKQW